MNIRPLPLILLAIVCLAPGSGLRAVAPSNETARSNPFFVLDNGLQDAAHRDLAAKAELLRELGYDGVGWRPGQVREMRRELEQRHLRMFTFYVGAKIGTDEESFDPNLPVMIRELQGSGAFIWLFLTSKQDSPSSTEGDERAIDVVRRIAELADQAGLQVALYPHHGLWLERIQDAVRLARKVNRANVGVTFNLCHCLRVGDAARIPQLLREARSHLFLVTINGADIDGKDWPTLIQTLDQGTYDPLTLMRELQAIGYGGPIGLQCYGLQGSVRDNLQQSLRAWEKLQRQLSSAAPGG